PSTHHEPCLWLFFLQAEDGIRDATVTGVQTCALPISSRRLRATPCESSTELPVRNETFRCERFARCRAEPSGRSRGRRDRNPPQIGRASCRGRVRHAPGWEGGRRALGQTT